MARRRLTPAQPGYLAPSPSAAPETKASPFASGPPIAKVSGQSAEAAALRELAEGIETARNEGRMIVDVPLVEISVGYLLRDRVALDREELEALKASLRAHGQRTPAEIIQIDGTRPENAPYRFGLISGWRRLRALSELYEETGEARFATLKALIRAPNDAGLSYVFMIEENEVRVGLSYYERARVVAETTARGVFPDQSTALRALFATASRAKRSKIGSFVTLYETLDDVLQFPADIPERLGLALSTALRNGAGPAIRDALSGSDRPDAAAELKLLDQLARGTPPPVSRAKQTPEAIRPDLNLVAERKGTTLTLKLSGAAVDDDLLETIKSALRSK